jgi:hypothetical protein
MPSIQESLHDESPLKGPLDAGLDTLSQNQKIRFTRYVKLILPLDGYVFWVRADMVSDVVVGGCYQASEPCTDCSKIPEDGTAPPGACIDVEGSLHYGTRVEQREDETIAINTVVFTAESEVTDFNRIGPCVMYIGEFEGRRFAFNRRGSFYKQAGLYHYQGDAVYPALESQLVHDLTCFDMNNVVVSNSLPIWLTLNQFMPMYPSFLVEENREPPYASIHIPPESTVAIGARPLWGTNGTHSQLVQEKVKITIYGLRNFSALDFQDYVLQYTLDNPTIMGVNNMPVIRDEKRTQSELTVIAQKKTFEIEINYYQLRARDIARQLILTCIPQFILEPL